MTVYQQIQLADWACGYIRHVIYCELVGEINGMAVLKAIMLANSSLPAP